MKSEEKYSVKLPITVYSWWWHPHKAWIDIILGFLLSQLIFAAPAFETPEASEGCDDEHQALVNKEASIKHADAMRTSTNKLIEPTLSGRYGGFRSWTAACGCDIVEATIKIPYRDDLFQEEGIISTAATGEKLDCNKNSQHLLTESITVHVAFPVMRRMTWSCQR